MARSQRHSTMPMEEATATSASASTSTSTTALGIDYLRGHPPALATLQGGLSIFAIVVILRFGIRLLRSWKPKHEESKARQQTLHQPVPWRPNLLDNKHPIPIGSASQYYYPSGISSSPANLSYYHQHPSENMGEKQPGDLGIGGGGFQDYHGGFRGNHQYSAQPSVDQRYQPGTAAPMRYAMARPPPAPPLTPPELSSTVFTLESRPHHGEDSLIHQPNPDYLSSTEPPSAQTSPSSSRHARRLSYNKTIPIGIPISRQSSASDADLFFSSSSYPPTSPILPPAPRTLSPSSSGNGSPVRREIELHGEIVGVLDDNGTGWSRHTRVYGGGACLACAAAGRHHGEGGFYGPNVLPEEMR